MGSLVSAVLQESHVSLAGSLPSASQHSPVLLTGSWASVVLQDPPVWVKVLVAELLFGVASF